MGCDIHLVLEEYDDELGWVGIDTFAGTHGSDFHSPEATQRNYARFATLAGVRGEGPVPRGLPDDTSATVLLLAKQWDGDAHSHSWLPLAEATELFNARHYQGEPPVDPKSFRDRWPMSYWFGVETEEPEKFRLVFWFDN